MTENCCKCTESEYELNEQNNQNRSIWGWQSIDDTARDIWGSIHSSLLAGDLVFAYKTGSQSDKLKQIVVVRNFTVIYAAGQERKLYSGYSVGYITSGYSALIPNVPLRYLTDVTLVNLRDWKVNKEIVNTFESILMDLEKEEEEKKNE